MAALEAGSKRVVELTETQNAAGAEQTQEGATRYSLVGRTAEGIEVYETSEEVRAMPYKERMARFQTIMEEEYAGRTARFDADGEIYYAKFAGGDLQKNIYGDKKSSPKGWKAKINTGADGGIFDLVEHADYAGQGEEKGGKKSRSHKGVTDWLYFVKRVQIDGQVYDLLANVRKKPDGEYVYSIQLNENKEMSASPVAADRVSGSALKVGDDRHSHCRPG